jgi:hypothetical protein
MQTQPLHPIIAGSAAIRLCEIQIADWVEGKSKGGLKASIQTMTSWEDFDNLSPVLEHIPDHTISENLAQLGVWKGWYLAFFFSVKVANSINYNS